MLCWLPSLWEQQASPLSSLSLCQACTAGGVFDLVPLNTLGLMEAPQVQTDHSEGESPFQKALKGPWHPLRLSWPQATSPAWESVASLPSCCILTANHTVQQVLPMAQMVLQDQRNYVQFSRKS